MKNWSGQLFFCFFLAFFSAQLSAAQPSAAQKASRESIFEFLDLVEVGQMVTKNVEVYRVQTLKRLSDKLDKSFPDLKSLSPKQQQLHSQGLKRITYDVNLYFSWVNLKEISIPIYQNSFSQKEMNELIAFAKTPTGNKFLKRIRAMDVAHDSAGKISGEAFNTSINSKLERLIEAVKKTK